MKFLIVMIILLTNAYTECLDNGRWRFFSGDTTSADTYKCEYDDTNKVATLYYQSNQIAYTIPQNGIGKRYYESGALKYESTFKNGKEEGIGKLYYESGALMWEVPFKNGKYEGIGKWYYESGALMWEIPYKNGKIEGIRKWYYESGALESEITFRNGKYEGIRKWYYKDSSLRTKTLYRNGKFVNKTYINEYGRTFYWQILPNGMCEGRENDDKGKRIYYGLQNGEYCN